jgi:hypothetical protein
VAATVVVAVAAAVDTAAAADRATNCTLGGSCLGSRNRSRLKRLEIVDGLRASFISSLGFEWLADSRQILDQ